jgi:hypothetical protein
MRNCAAYTLKGTKCRFKAVPGSKYCTRHMKHSANSRDRNKDIVSELLEFGGKKFLDKGIDHIFKIFESSLPFPYDTEFDLLDSPKERDSVQLLPHRSSIPVSASSFAQELINSGKKFSLIVESNNPLNKDLTEDEIEEFAKAIAKEVLKKLLEDPQFKNTLKEEVNDLKHTLPSNILANAIVKGVGMALFALI